MKKAFTLIELIIIIGILSLLIGSISFFVPTKQDTKIQFGRECSNYIFQEIINEQNNIKKNKIIKSGNIILNPTKTIIQKNSENEISIINYYNEEQSYTKILVNNMGNCLNEKINNQANFFIYSNISEISLKKDEILFPEEINIKACELAEVECINISKITYNKTNNKFEQKFCLSLIGNNCSIWEE